MTIPDRNLAFPGLLYDEHGDAVGHCYGMTLRDYFAAAAMSAYLSAPNPNLSPEEFAALCAGFAYGLADAMLAERSKGSPT